MLFEIARNVRSRIVEEVRKAPGSGTRPHGNQTPLHHAPGGRSLFWLRAESNFRSPGNRTAAKSAWARLLSVTELRGMPVDARGGNRKTSAGVLAGVDRRRNSLRHVLETSVHSRIQLHSGLRKGRTRQPSAAVRARAHDCRRSPGDLAQRRNGLDDHSALRVEGHDISTKNILDICSGKKLCRE